MSPVETEPAETGGTGRPRRRSQQGCRLQAVAQGGVAPGDMIVANKNFGCGSSREHAPIAIKASGVSLVIANTFARIFYRNSINIGLPILECPAASKAIQNGDEVAVDFDTGVIENLATGETYQAEPFPPFIQNIIQKGGLLASLK